MLDKSKRLNISEHFKFVASGQKVLTDSFKIYFRVVNIEKPLVGIAVAKKDFPKATQRNKAKRLVSKAVEGVYDRLRKGLNLVIMPREAIFNHDQKRLETELANVKGLYKDD